MRKRGERLKKKASTFVVRILNTQNGSWQGEITWVQKKETQYFRSALELITMMQEAVGNGRPGSDKPGPEEHDA